MNGADPAGRLRFRGAPLTLAALVGQGGGVAGEHPIQLAAPEKAVLAGGRELRAISLPEDGLMRLHLPRSTPPGTYQATMNVAGEEREVEIVVDPEVYLRLFPERLILSASAGARLSEQLTIMNLGNVEIQVRGAYAFGLFDVGGVERAVARMVTAGEGQRRADVFADAIAEEHGGLVRMKVESGEGTVPPGEAREMNLTLQVPQNVRPGHTYWGTWPLYNVRYYVRITGEAAQGEVVS